MENVPAKIPTREDIQRLQGAVAQLPPVDFPTTHHFAEGLYIRQMRAPAGSVIVGKIHRKEHVFILQQGEMTVTGDGLPPRRLVAPCMMISPPGVKRAGFAHTDCLGANVFLTDLTDLEALERELIEPEAMAPLYGPGNERLR